MTKINFEFIKKIFNRKIELKKKEDKIKLSNYNEYIPMYDIYSDNIYPIPNLEIHHRLINCHYRFITSEIKKWIENKYKKTKEKNYLKQLKILDNYIIDILEKTSYDTLYKFSPELGLSISICKRNSFHPFSKHLNPYYSKNELIKLGMNNKIIKKMTPESLIDKELHYKICKLVSKNDISNKLISNHTKHIIDTKCINWINFYSFTGSYIFNDYLRTPNIKLSKYLVDGLKSVSNSIKKIDGFQDNFYFYRLIWDDKFLKNLKIGDIFLDKGFLSTTRDPFYSPGMDMDFGLILLKINIPKNKKGVGLFIENFSMFPKEEEFLLLPHSKFKLLSKDDKFDYKHIDDKFEKKIKKKYEFTFVSNSLNLDNLKVSSDSNIPEINLKTVKLSGNYRQNLFKQFLENCDEMNQFKYNNKIYSCQYFDSTGSYQNIYYNQINNGFSICLYNDGFPELFIECGVDYVVNYLHKNSYYDKVIETLDLEVISLIGKIFGYKNAKVFFPYRNFSDFKDNYDEKNSIFLYNNLYCHPIYLYLKKKKKHFENKYLKFEYGYYKLDKIFNDIVPQKYIKLIPEELREDKLKWNSLLISIVEKYFYLYNNLEDWINESYNDLFKKCNFDFDILIYLKNNNYDISYFPTINTNESKILNRQFDLIFNNEFRRSY